MSAETAILLGRHAAEALMVDACTVAVDGTATTDDLTGAVTNTPATLYAGKCKVQQVITRGRRFDTGEASEVLLRIELHLPIVGSELVARDAIVTITVATLDTALVGRRFRIHDESHKSFATARRLGCEEVT